MKGIKFTMSEKSIDEEIIYNYEDADECGCEECSVSVQDYIAEKFNLLPPIKLGKSGKRMLKAIAELGKTDFYELCEFFDARPSDVEHFLNKLLDKNLIDVSDDAEISLNAVGERYLILGKKGRKAEKKFRKFIASLNDEELMDFCDLCAECGMEDLAVEDCDDEDCCCDACKDSTEGKEEGKA